MTEKDSVGRRKPLTPDDARHGTTTGYAAGCREDCCREANNTYWRDRRRREKQLTEPRKADDLGQGFQRRCSCGHTPGEHAIPKLGQPQPCDVKYCRCKDLDRPKVPEIRYHEGIQGPIGRRLA